MILKRGEVEKIENYIEEVYGARISLKNYVVLKTGKKERIWIVNREVLELPIEKLRINSLGLYFGRWDNGKIRLSIEGAMLIKPERNFVKIKDWKDFVRGFDIKVKCNCENDQYVIVKYKEDTLGIAKYRDGVLENVLPKGRKLKKLSYL